MPSQWITKVDRGQNSEFDDFLGLLNNYRARKTSAMAKLRFRIKKIWDSYPIEKKKEYTARLIEADAVEPEIANLIRMFGGAIIDFGVLINEEGIK